VRRSFGLVLLLWALNLALAAPLALALAQELQGELHEREAARGMLYGFDYAWWSEWSGRQQGFASGFAPAILGVGFVLKNVDALLRGWLPLGLFSRGAAPDAAAGFGFEVLALGAAYLLLQVFLAGGVLGVLRGPQGSWSFRGLIHGSGFYFARLLRVTLLGLFGVWLVFLVNAPLARWADAHAREAVSEATANAWLLGRHALLLLALLLVHLVASYARAIVVLEERSSAVLALVSALAFCARQAGRVVGHALAIAVLGGLLLAAWSALDGAWDTVGWRTQALTLLLAQALVVGRVALRLAFLGGQISLYRRLGAA
jgi:hypothetical protein